MQENSIMIQLFLLYQHPWAWNRGSRIRQPHCIALRLSILSGWIGKECRSKRGLTIHRKQMNKVSKVLKTFSCNKRGETYQQEANLLNHREFAQECSGEIVRVKKYVAKRQKCSHFKKEMAATNVSRHIREICKGRWDMPLSEAYAFSSSSFKFQVSLLCLTFSFTCVDEILIIYN